METISIDSGTTLIIEPGVVVVFNVAKVLVVNGAIKARGNASDSIRFSSIQTDPKVGDWGYVHFTSTVESGTADENGSYIGGSIFEYCIFEYGGAMGETPVAMIKCDESQPLINYCTIRDNAGNGIGGITGGVFHIKNSLITRNAKTGIHIQGDLRVRNCSINSNGQDGIYHRYGSLRVDNSTIQNNDDYGLSHLSGPDAQNAVHTIDSNTISGNGLSGLFFSLEKNSNSFIRSNMVHTNSSSGIVVVSTDSQKTIISHNCVAENKGVGILDSTFSGCDTISYNSITFNELEGLRKTGNGIITHNAICTNNTSRVASSREITIVSGSPVFTFNSIGTNDSDISLSVLSVPAAGPLDATNNWWSQTDEAAVGNTVFDNTDSSDVAEVTIAPLLSAPDATTPILPPTITAYQETAGGMVIEWQANAEPDLAGYIIYFGDSLEYSVDAGTETSYTLEGLSRGDSIAVTAYDNSANGHNDQLEGHESWFSRVGVADNPTVFNIAVAKQLSPLSIRFNARHDALVIMRPLRKTTEFTLHDLKGTLLLSKKFTPFHTLYEELNLRDFSLASGVYIATLRTESMRTSAAFSFVRR